LATARQVPLQQGNGRQAIGGFIAPAHHL
jgi:hypothetical protein